MALTFLSRLNYEEHFHVSRLEPLRKQQERLIKLYVRAARLLEMPSAPIPVSQIW